MQNNSDKKSARIGGVCPADAMVEFVHKARQGDRAAREEILARHRDFVHKVASTVCRRVLTWDNDDELSVGLIALNEAVDAFDPAVGLPFESFARLVIRRRLTDHLRREYRHRSELVELPPGDEDLEDPPLRLPETREAWLRYKRDVDALERVEELDRYERYLREFDLTLDDVERACPRHRDTRQNLMRVAIVLAGHPQMRETLRRTKRLPLRQLTAEAGVSRKVLDTGRKYLLALTVVLMNPELEHLRGFLEFPDRTG